jgi:mono/diheme cytochrome c family protein
MKKALLVLLFISYSICLKAQKRMIPPVNTVSGKLLYQQYCMTCHQVDGAGAPNMIPPLIKTSLVRGAKTNLINIILKGLSGEMKVNGDTYDGEMPALAHLKDKEIAAILTYIRSSFGNKATPITAFEVKKTRASLKINLNGL